MKNQNKAVAKIKYKQMVKIDFREEGMQASETCKKN